MGPEQTFAMKGRTIQRNLQSDSTWNRCTLGARSRVSAYADGMSIFVSCRGDIEVLQKAFERYKKFTWPRLAVFRLAVRYLGADVSLGFSKDH